MARVIAIAGPPGSGKSTLAYQLAAELGKATVLEFDRYEQATAQSVESIARWLDEGANFEALAAPGLKEDLEQLVADPAFDFVVFEMPLGRTQRNTAAMIDLLVWIDIPSDIALARKLHQLTRQALASPDPQRGLGWLHGYLEAYLSVVHRVFQKQKVRVRPDADICVDGLSSSRDIAWMVRERVNAGRRN